MDIIRYRVESGLPREITGILAVIRNGFGSKKIGVALNLLPQMSNLFLRLQIGPRWPILYGWL